MSVIEQYRARLRAAAERMASLQDALVVERNRSRPPIAVVGMACRFPSDYRDPDAFFAGLLAGRDSVSAASRPGAYGRAGYLEQVRRFDAEFFGITPREAAALDPQQRLLLEVTWEALERAGCPPSRIAADPVGIYVGLTSSDYLELGMRSSERDIYSLTGNGHCFAAGRLAYALGFQGPALTVDTACSSALVAIHLAIASLRSGESTVAIAGAANLLLSPTTSVVLERSGALAPDGRCKAFDAAADGFVRGEGVGVVVLERLDDALRNGDPVLAVIRGSAVNQDGRSTGLTAPNARAQQDMLRRALADAGLRPSDIGFIETHGTGTALGDPIELAALHEVFGETSCVLGAVKTNVGHLEAAAGMAGFMKAVGCLQRGVIPPNLHFHQPNPHAAATGASFILPTAPQPWPSTSGPRRAGVSAFGMSGTNAHVLLEEAPAGTELPAVAAPFLLPVSARDPLALRHLARGVAGLLRQGASLPDVAYTAAARRTHFEHRIAVTGHDPDAMAATLEAFADGARPPGLLFGQATEPRTVFVFSGQGSVWPGMGAALDGLPHAQQVLDAIEALVQRHGGFSLREAMEDERIGQTDRAQPALLAMAVAITTQLRAWGVEPGAVIGHSVGEIAAAHVAGALRLEDAVRLACTRGRLMQRVAGRGGMVWVALPARELATRLSLAPDLAIAAINGSRSTVVSGSSASLEALVAELAGARTRRLPVDYAFHGPQMDPLQVELRAALEGLATAPGSLSIFSTLTGGVVDGTQLDPAYWARGIRQPVRFADAVEAAVGSGYRLFVEVGPHPVLGVDLADGLGEAAGRAVATLRRDGSGRAELIETLARLHVEGQPVDFEALGRGRVVALPCYPFADVEHWLGTEARPVIPAEPIVTVASDTASDTASIESRVDAIARGILGIAKSAPLSPRQGLFDLGMDSMMAMELNRRLQTELGIPMTPTAVFEHPTIEQLAAHISGAAPIALRGTSVASNEPIAIIGMACRFPGGANDPEALWSRLCAAVDGTSPAPPDRWDEAVFYDPDPTALGTMYARRSGFLQGVDVAELDAPFFRISPAEARGIDPQQRLLLELAWEALEDAGQPADPLVGSHTSVYMGIATADYAQLCLQVPLAELDPYITTGNAPNIAAGRISNFLGLRGPAIALDTACSSSLVATHLGCASLRRGESDLSIVGGVNLILGPVLNVLYARMGTLAPDSRCKAFDAAADGMVRGEGAGVVVLKRLADAHRDGDQILAVIRGSAINHDGRSGGLTVPSGAAQRAVVRAALHDAGVEPGDVGFVETHGTGTRLGDPIEANALVAELQRDQDRPLWLGSAKASFGHLEAASGVLGLIKAVLALRHGQIPPQRNFSTLNPAIVLGDVPLRIPTELTPWTTPRRIAGVSAFGVSGTNAHVVLEHAEPSPPTAGATREGLLLPISARDPEALRVLARSYLERLGPESDLLCAAAALRRAHLEHRLAITGSSAEDLRTALHAWLDGTLHPGWTAGHAESSPRLAFVFSGYGGHWIGMGRGLMGEPAFADTLGACEAVAGRPFIDDLTAADAEARWANPEVLQPLVLALQLGLAAQWRAWGVHPHAAVGHSGGEIAAAHVCGAISLADAFAINRARTRIVARLAGQGATATVALSVDDLERRLASRSHVDVAASNSPRVTVVSGTPEAVGRLCEELSASNVFVRPMLENPGAGHSPLLDPHLPELREALSGLSPRAPSIEFYSSGLGRKLGDEPLDAAYWVRNFRDPVRFTQATRALGDAGFNTFLELSPHPLLLSAIEQTLRPLGGGLTRVGSLRQGTHDRRAMLEALARLHTAGLDVRWSGVHPEGCRAHPLPRYPWQRQRYWLPGPFVDGARTAGLPRTLYDRRVVSARPPHETYYESSLDSDRAATLGVPQVLGHRVVSAGLLLALARETVGGAIEQLELYDAAVIEDSLDLQLVDGDDGFEVFVREPDGWRRIAAGRRGPPIARDALDVDEGEPDPAQGQRWQARGLELARGSLEAVTRGPTTACARLAGRAEDPAILEAALRLLASLVHPPGEAPLEGELFELRRCGQASLGEGTVEWVRARVRGPVGSSFGALGDVQLLDAEGRPVSTVCDVQLGVDRSQARRALLERQDRWLYTVEWPVAEPSEPAASQPGVWLLCPDDGGFAQALADRLQSRGDVVVIAGESPARSLVDARARGPLKGVVDLQGLDLDDTAVLDAVERSSLALLEWIQALGQEGLPHTFVLITRGAQPVGPGPLCVSAAPLWGLGRTIGLEYPALRARLIDLDPARPPDELSELIAILDDLGPESCFALRQGTRHVERLLRAPPFPATPPLKLRSDATYLVTGGLGGAGLQVARWLVDRGARHLVLLGRSGASTPEQRAAVEGLLAQGATVNVAAADVADPEALGLLLDAIPQDQPLRGIFHAAGITDPRPLADTTPETLRRLYHAKVGGAWALHTKTRTLDLDHFVLFSSAASVWGAALLGPYGAANHFLDALAHQRRTLGLPALSVNWGGWSGGGMATADAQRYASDMGLAITPAAMLLEAMDLFITAETVRIAIVSVRWRVFKAVLEARGERPLLAEIEVEAGSREGGEVAASIKAAAPAARWALLVEHVQSRASSILGFSGSDGLDPEAGFFSLGMDSVMSVRLRNELERDMGVPLPPTLAFEQPDVLALSRWLAQETLEMDIPIPQRAAGSKLDELSEAELESLLAQELDA